MYISRWRLLHNWTTRACFSVSYNKIVVVDTEMNEITLDLRARIYLACVCVSVYLCWSIKSVHSAWEEILFRWILSAKLSEPTYHSNFPKGTMFAKSCTLFGDICAANFSYVLPPQSLKLRVYVYMSLLNFSY